jgi:hypothetical protein
MFEQPPMPNTNNAALITKTILDPQYLFPDLLRLIHNISSHISEGENAD